MRYSTIGPPMALLIALFAMGARAEVEVDGILGTVDGGGYQRVFTPCFGQSRPLGPDEPVTESVFTCAMLQELHTEMTDHGISDADLPPPGLQRPEPCPQGTADCLAPIFPGAETNATGMVWVPACEPGTPGCGGDYVAVPNPGVAPAMGAHPMGARTPTWHSPYRERARRSAGIGAASPCPIHDTTCQREWRQRRASLASQPLQRSDSLLMNEAARRQFEALKRWHVRGRRQQAR